MSYSYGQMHEASAAVAAVQQQHQLLGASPYLGATTTADPGNDVNSYPMSNVVYPGHNDVMCGRGGGTNNHIGNIRFRQLVQGHKLRYLAAPKIDKPRVAREVVMIWRGLDPPGRFLTKTKAEAGDASPWHDVGDKKAREKASQCLRERTPDVIPFIKLLQLREAREKEKEEGAVRPESVKSESNDTADAETEEATKRFEAALAQSNDPIAQARLTQYLNDTAPANTKIRARQASMESTGSHLSAGVVPQAYTAAASNAVLASNTPSADWGTMGVGSTDEERLRQQQILEQARQAQEAALVQARAQNCVNREDFEARQIVSQIGTDHAVHQQQQQQDAAAAFAMQAQAQALAAQEQQRQIMEQAKAVQRQAQELDRQRAEMEKQRMQEQAAAAAMAAQLEVEKRKLQEQAAALRSSPADVTDDEDVDGGRQRHAQKRSSREELANSIPSAAELMDDFGGGDGVPGIAGDEELTQEEYQKSIELFLSTAPGGMPPPAPKPPKNKSGENPDPMPSRADMMETMSQTSWVKSFASIDSSSTMLFSISGQSLKNIVEGEQLEESQNNLAHNDRRESNATLPAGNTRHEDNDGGAGGGDLPISEVAPTNNHPEMVHSSLVGATDQQPVQSRSQRLRAANANQTTSTVSMISDLTDISGLGTATDKSKTGKKEARANMMKSAGGMNSNISMMSELTDLSDQMSALGMKDP